MNYSPWMLIVQFLLHASIRRSSTSAFVLRQQHFSRPPQLRNDANERWRFLCKAQNNDEYNIEPSDQYSKSTLPTTMLEKEPVATQIINESSGSPEDHKPVFDSLDVVLERARKRKMVLLPIRIQSFANKPLVKLGTFTYLSVGECALLLIAIKLESYGFSLGYVVGKGTAPYLRRKISTDSPMAAFVELWAGGFAIFSDVIWNNVF